MRSPIKRPSYIDDPYPKQFSTKAILTTILLSFLIWLWSLNFLRGVAGIVDVAIVGGIAEWYWYYRNAPESIKADLSRSRRSVILTKTGKLLLFILLAAVPVYTIFGISTISSVVIYIVAVGILVVTSGNLALADLSRAKRKYRNLEQRVTTINDDAFARVKVDITPPLETLSPKQYKSVDDFE